MQYRLEGVRSGTPEWGLRSDSFTNQPGTSKLEMIVSMSPGLRTEAAPPLPGLAEGIGWPRAQEEAVPRKCHLGFGHRFWRWRGHLADISRPCLTLPPHTFIQQAFPATYPVPVTCWKLLLGGTCEPFQAVALPHVPGLRAAASARLEQKQDWKFLLHP